MNLESLPEICSEKDIAQYLGFAPSTIRTMCISGEMPHRRIRTHYRIMKQDFIEYLEAAKCQKRTEEHPSNGGQRETYGRSSGMKAARGAGSQRAIATARRQIKNLKTSRKEQRRDDPHA